MADIYIIIRKAVSYYIENNVKKYFKFSDLVDIDETMIG
jgi:hypothetical protein